MKKVMIKKIIAGLIGSLLTATAFAAVADVPSIIPLPQKMEQHAGTFGLSPDTKIFVSPGSSETAGQLATALRKSTGYPLKISLEIFPGATPKNSIFLTTRNAGPELGPEGYELTVATNSVVIRAPTQAGLFYGTQTLLQLLPPEIFSSNVVRNVNWQMPCVQIEDWPRFQWRGLMLDVSRHFYDKTEVEKILDEMALFKLNTFHWHLTDDQGWRIEIKKYPKLTQIGAWRPASKLDPSNGEGEGPADENTHPAWAEVASSKFDPAGR